MFIPASPTPKDPTPELKICVRTGLGSGQTIFLTYFLGLRRVWAVFFVFFFCNFLPDFVVANSNPPHVLSPSLATPSFSLPRGKLGKKNVGLELGSG